MSDHLHNPEQQPIALGDYIIPTPAQTWDTHTLVPRGATAVWELVSRIGLQGEEGGAGYFLPKSVERILPRRLRSIGSLAINADELPEQRQVGDKLRDFGEGVATVAVVDHETRTIVLDSHFPVTRKRSEGQHYTWTLHVGENETTGEADIATRMRFKTPLKPGWLRRLMPGIDQWGMNMVSKGLAQRIPLGL